MSTCVDDEVPSECHRLRLAPDPSAARDARVWVVGLLSDWPKESVDTARLLVSELVTNAVLHARTVIEVACRRDGARARFEVIDGRGAGPTPKCYALDSPTGRGIWLVASLAEEWGVERDVGGKKVWFVVSPATRAVARADPASVASRLEGELGTDTIGTDTIGTDTIGTDTIDVVARSLPVDVYIEGEQHNDAIVRELAYIVRSAESESGLEVPRRLLQLAADVDCSFSAVSDGLRAQVEDAVRRGQATVDLHLSVPRHGWEALLRLADWLDEVDRYCEEGDLLTLASSPRLRRFRAWYATQVADQVRGRPPTAWQGTSSD